MWDAYNKDTEDRLWPRNTNKRDVGLANLNHGAWSSPFDGRGAKRRVPNVELTPDLVCTSRHERFKY